MHHSPSLLHTLAVAMAALASAGCNAEPIIASSSASGTAPPGASSSTGSSDAGACGAIDAQSSPESGSWDPNGDSTFHQVGWRAPEPCLVEFADQPRAAAAPLVWEACVHPVDGCLQRAENWPSEYTGYMAMPSVARSASGYRVAWQITLKSTYEQRAVVYDVDGAPMAVWRVAESHGCSIVRPILGRERLWLGAQGLTEKTGARAAYITEPLDALGSAGCTLPIDMPSQGQAASDDVLALWGLNGINVALYDRKASTWKQFGNVNQDVFWLPQPVGRAALVRHYQQPEHAQAWMWNGATGAMQQLIATGNDIVPDVQSDGETLVWVRTPPKSVPESELYPQGDLWTSPFATTPSGLTPKKRRPAPLVSGGGNSAAGEGFYAVVSYADLSVHVYRLSDAHHWSFPFQTPPSLMPSFRGVVYVDKDEVWYITESSIYRQRLDALGPGDAAP